MKLIVGLGNPGRKYAKTRHNTGFLVLDRVATHFGVAMDQKKFNGHYAKLKVGNQDVILLQPQTYMNLSGESVFSFVQYFKIELQDILIIMDDLDLPVGKIRLKTTGSDGGQRGMRNIIHQLGTQNINRLKVGIDNNKLIETVDYVLGKVEEEKLADYQDSLKRAADCAIDFITMEMKELMNKYNANGKDKNEVA